MLNEITQSSLFTEFTEFSSSQCQPSKTKLRTYNQFEFNQMLRNVTNPLEARVNWFGKLEKILKQQIGSKHGLAQLLEQINGLNAVLVVDFNWTNFATFFNHDSWGNVVNLHPRNCLEERENTINKLLSQTLEPELRKQLEVELLPERKDRFRREVRLAMLEKLVEVARDYQIVVTETLDVLRLDQYRKKQQVIEDLGWKTLLPDFQELLERQGIKLVLLERDYKSLTCPNCQHVDHKNRIQNSFRCVNCRFEAEPDFISGMNMWADWLAHGHPNMEKTK
ncbi:MAG: hypothetical protein RLZZ156_2533 [Deinococcota bacterium]